MNTRIATPAKTNPAAIWASRAVHAPVLLNVVGLFGFGASTPPESGFGVGLGVGFAVGSVDPPPSGTDGDGVGVGVGFVLPPPSGTKGSDVDVPVGVGVGVGVGSVVPPLSGTLGVGVGVGVGGVVGVGVCDGGPWTSSVTVAGGSVGVVVFPPGSVTFSTTAVLVTWVPAGAVIVATTVTAAFCPEANGFWYSQRVWTQDQSGPPADLNSNPAGKVSLIVALVIVLGPVLVSVKM